MKRIIGVRHGNYHFSTIDHLSSIGKNQMMKIVELLRPIVGDGTTAILSSVANRAKESAEILADGLGITFSEHEILWSENCHPEDLPLAIELIRSVSDNIDNVILVTHLEYCEKLPRYYGRYHLDIDLGYIEIEKGEAWVIDCENKELVVIR